MTLRALWLALGWAMVLAVVWLSLTPSPPTIDVEQGDKLGHLLAYGAMMFWFAQIHPRTAPRLRYAIGFVVLGVALEFVQAQVGRDFEVADMAADAVGVALGWGAALIAPLRFLSA